MATYRLLRALLFVAFCAVGVVQGQVKFDYNAYAQDWKDIPDSFCGSNEQSPIDIMNKGEISSYKQMPMDFAPVFDLPTVSDVKANHNGYNINFEFPATPGATFRFPEAGPFLKLFGEPEESVDSLVPAEVQGTLIDIHWHVPSEHTINGILYPAEAHFVHAIEREGDPDCTYQGNMCLAVVGVLYGVVVDEEDERLNPGFFSAMEKLVNLPEFGEADTGPLETVDFNAFLPESKDFWSYRGSLTSPPCDEKVSWFLLQEPVMMTWAHYAKLRDAILNPELGNNNARPPLPLNDRKVFMSNFEDAETQYPEVMGV